MLWNWFTQRLPISITRDNRAASMQQLIEYLNDKYGDFEYVKDARALDSTHEFEKEFSRFVDKAIIGGAKTVLIAGANNGTELDVLSRLELTAIDLSDVALRRLQELHPEAIVRQADMQDLPFPNKAFDMYVAMRSVHATNLDTSKALEESLRTTRLFAIYSISNGYNLEGRLQKGMYDYDRGEIDTHLPYEHLEAIKDFLEERGCKLEICEVPSEIIIFARLPRT